MASSKRTSSKKTRSCLFCPAQFRLKSQLMSHMHADHEVIGKYACKVCDQSFSSERSLQRHLLLHTGEQPYSCNICLKRFAQKDNYTGHMNMHSGARPYQCKNCFKTFTYVCNLSRHKKSCTFENYQEF